MRHRKEGHMKTEAEMGVTEASLSPGTLRSPATTRSKERGVEESPLGLQKELILPRPRFLKSGLQNSERIKPSSLRVVVTTDLDMNTA